MTNDIRGRVRRGIVALGLSIGLVGAGSGGASGGPSDDGPGERRHRDLTVATYNLYLGANLAPLYTATSQEELVRRAAEVYAHMVKTDFPSRAEAIAAQLAHAPPDAVGLQEVALWEAGPIGGELRPTYDFLRLLVDALAARGLPYRAVATNTNFVGALPIGPETMARFTDRDVILVRSDRPGRGRHHGFPGRHIRVRHVESHNFEADLVIATPIPGLSFRVPRGWSAVDVTIRGQTVRLANTHLEAFDRGVRNAQAGELREALAQSPHPVVLAGDLNSEPTDRDGAYGMFAGAGYRDGWTVVHGPDGGFTAGQTDDLDNVPSRLDHRVDYVLYEPRRVGAVEADVLGDELDDRTPAGLWPSDHAGVAVRLRLGPRVP